MFWHWLDQLNQYSSLILVLVTIVYVVLTGWMVREMRKAREEELKPHLIATLVFFGPLHVKLRIQNAGRGPALGIKGKWWLEPADSTEPTVWEHPVLLSGAFEDFTPPGGELQLAKLASKHDRLIMNLHWLTAFKKQDAATYQIDLKRQKDAWYNAKNIVPPDDIPTQLHKITAELSKISRHFDKLESQRVASDLLRDYRRTHTWWYKLQERIAQYARTLLQRMRT